MIWIEKFGWFIQNNADFQKGHQMYINAIHQRIAEVKDERIEGKGVKMPQERRDSSYDPFLLSYKRDSQNPSCKGIDRIKILDLRSLDRSSKITPSL